MVSNGACCQRNDTSLTHRLAKAGKVRFATLLRAAYEGRRIHG